MIFRNISKTNLYFLLIFSGPHKRVLRKFLGTFRFEEIGKFSTKKPKKMKETFDTPLVCDLVNEEVRDVVFDAVLEVVRDSVRDATRCNKNIFKISKRPLENLDFETSNTLP